MSGPGTVGWGTRHAPMRESAATRWRNAVAVAWYWLTSLACISTVAAMVFCSPAARAHELSMAEMELREVAAGDFVWQWTASNRAAGDDLTPQWPAPCHAQAQQLSCAGGLKGSFSIDGVGKRYSAVIVRIVWLDGQSRVYTLSSGQKSVLLQGAADDQRGWAEVARAYTTLGLEHILTGWDHLLFVLGLLFLVGFERRLIVTITAFTLAHSLTLALSTLGWVSLRSPPVEAAIALSIVLVAVEALDPKRQSWSHRWPALVAFLFGLVHGLGFAGALQDIGLPQDHVPAALLFFNAGVELGQLLVIALAYGALRAWAALPALPPALRLRAPALYGIGTVAAYWVWSRGVAIWS